MSISSRITSIEEHIGDIYDTLELGGADLTNTDKNLVNVKPILKQKYLDYMNNGTREIWNNWEKVPTATGENVTLNNTVQAPMDLGVGGNTSQDTSILPTGYTQLDYIESTGTQYIDTGFKPTQNTTKVIFDGIYLSTNRNYFAGIVQSNIYYGMRPHESTVVQWNNGAGAVGTVNISLDYLNKRLVYKYDGYKLYINDVLKADLTTGSDATFNLNLYLFARNNNGTTDTYANFKLYSCKIYDNTTLVRDYVPCKNASNEVGLYDLVSKTFFGNLGTGTFTAGNTATIPNPDFEVPISNVTGDVEVLVQNKNLFDGNQTFVNAQYGTDGTYYDNQPSRVMTDFIPIEYAKNYTIFCDLLNNYDVSLMNYNFFDKDKIWLGNRITNGDDDFRGLKQKSFTVNIANTKYIRIVFRSYSSASTALPISNVQNAKIQLEYGSTASTYTPHQEQTYTFPLGTQRMYLGDYLADDGIHHVRKQTEITAENVNSLVGGLNTTTYSKPYITISKSLLGWKNSWTQNISLINNYSVITSTSKIESGTYAVNFIQSYLTIFDDRFTDLATARQLLIGTIIEIEQANEWIEPYTSEQQQAYDEIKQAISYEEQTNISGSSDEANPIFTVVALKNI